MSPDMDLLSAAFTYSHEYSTSCEQAARLLSCLREHRYQTYDNLWHIMQHIMSEQGPQNAELLNGTDFNN